MQVRLGAFFTLSHFLSLAGFSSKIPTSIPSLRMSTFRQTSLIAVRFDFRCSSFGVCANGEVVRNTIPHRILRFRKFDVMLIDVQFVDLE